MLNPSVAYREADKARIIAAYYERPNMRGIERSFAFVGWRSHKGWW